MKNEVIVALAASASALIGIAISPVAGVLLGGELNEILWSVFAGAVLTGAVMTFFGIVLAVSRRAQPPLQPAN